MNLDRVSWLVSYEYQIVHKTKLGLSAAHPVKFTGLIMEHPAKFFAARFAEYAALNLAEYSTETASTTAELIRSIYSVTEVPVGVLTMDDVLAYKQVDESENE